MHRLPNNYRAVLLALLRSLYIDREPNEEIAPLSYLRIWTKVKPAPQQSPWLKADPWQSFPNLAPTPHFSDLREKTTVYLLENSSFDVSKTAKNRVTLEYITTAHMLLKFGMYFPDGKRSLKSLSDNLLDGLTGMLGMQGEKASASGDASDSAAFDLVIQAKKICVKAIVFIFDCRQEERIRVAFEAFERCVESLNQTRSFVDKSTGLLPGVGLQMETFGEGGREKLTPMSAKDIDKRAMEYLHTKLFRTVLLNEQVAPAREVLKPTLFVRDLLRLTLLPNRPFVKEVFALLYRHYDQQCLFTQNLMAQQIIVYPEVANSVSFLQADVSELRRNLKWISAPSDSARTLAYMRVPQILKHWTSLCQEGSVVTMPSGEANLRIPDRKCALNPDLSTADVHTLEALLGICICKICSVSLFEEWMKWMCDMHLSCLCAFLLAVFKRHKCRPVSLFF